MYCHSNAKVRIGEGVWHLGTGKMKEIVCHETAKYVDYILKPSIHEPRVGELSLSLDDCVM